MHRKVRSDSKKSTRKVLLTGYGITDRLTKKYFFRESTCMSAQGAAGRLLLFLQWIVFALIWQSLIGCRKPEVAIPLPTEPAGPYLSRITEHRYTPIDSITIDQLYDQSGKLSEEKFSQQSSRRAYTLYHLYQSANTTVLANKNDYYRFYQVNTEKQLIASQLYYSTGLPYWSVYEKDTLIYQHNDLVRQDHWDYAFTADNQPHSFAYPLWLTRRYFSYDEQHHLVGQVDSVYITHDISTSITIQRTPARYLFVNFTSFQYDQHGKLSKETSRSDRHLAQNMRFSSGTDIFSEYGLGWSTTAQSWPGRFLSGVTMYSTSYHTDGRIAQTKITFEDAATNRSYVSTRLYRYSNQ